MKVFDPYDIWACPSLGRLKHRWYQGDKSAGIVLRLVALLDALAPVPLRRMLGVDKHDFAHVEAMLLPLTLEKKNSVVSKFRSMLTSSGGWGLPFDWYSKNGVYDANTPYVTNTPYVMEALLSLAETPELHEEAMALFHGTWGFLESLKIMHGDANMLALSYAPVDEPRKVVNANAYAAFAYGLHAVHGRESIRDQAREKATRLACWVTRQQKEDGGWFYYADNEPGNFIDGFHSCFIVKNLLKMVRLLPETQSLVDESIARGWAFIQENLLDKEAGLCRRFVQRSHRDPYKWDLYDQAEFLGLLVDFKRYEEAGAFATRVEQKFRKGNHWYCRIDIFGRRWGRDFLRWGIAPFLYHRARLQVAVKGSC
ncbi:hypothetical protein [Geoalkalibacter sp.]|uniref:hypothetical protein n=1 Tax=Geoalkalibacter sp. TaxID=3041440 RepID=UPI00272EB222|nr:hypothetical protein [Geoalkalibacter sp.]